MKTKTNLKILLALGLILIAMIIFNANPVSAKEVTEDYLQNILDKIPNAMNLDIPEVEFEKADDIVRTNVKNVLNKENIEYEEIKNSNGYYELKIKDAINGYDVKMYTMGGAPIYFGKDNFDKSTVHIYAIKNNITYNSKEKEIKITYNNSNNYNKADEQYVKNLKITSPRYYEVGLDFLALDFDTQWDKFHYNIVSNYYTKLVNDKSIVVKADSGAGDGGLNIINGEGGTYIGIFKNGILYDIRKMGSEVSVPVINVPNTVSESEINNYVISQITKYNKDLGKYISSITKGTKNIDYMKLDIPDGYTVTLTETTDVSLNVGAVIIRRDKTVAKTDETTKVKLNTNTDIVPADTILVAKPQDETTVKETLKDIASKFTAYDITLTSNGVKVQPNGKVKISIPVPSDYNKGRLVVYRVDEDGTKTKYDVKVEDNYATFETDHFSTYVLAELKEETTTNTSNTPTTVNKGEKDDTPKTGVADITPYIMAVAVISAVGIIATRSKEEK